MEIVKEINGSSMVMRLEGRLDTTTAPELEAVFKESLGDINELVLDFSNLAYISSAGLRVILSGHKTMAPKGGMKLIGVSESVKEVFDVTGFSDIINIA